MTRRCLLYLRQSLSRGKGTLAGAGDGERRDSLSLRAQERGLRERAEREGWAVVGVEQDQDLRGWQDEGERPGLAACLDRAAAGGYDVLLLWDMSRLARLVRLQEPWVWQLARHGVDVVSHTEPHASDELMRVIFGAFAQRQTTVIAGHVRSAIRARAEAGKWHGPAPFGLIRDAGGGLVPGEERDVAGVRLAYRLADQGRTLAAIAGELAAAGCRPTQGGVRWYVSTVRVILTNPIYVGRLRIGAVARDDAVDPLIERDRWERVQVRLAASHERAGRRRAAPTFLAGLARCGCGRKLYPISHRASDRPHRVTLRCGTVGATETPCAQPRRSVELHVAEAFALRQLAADLAARPPWRDAYRAAVAAHRAAAPRYAAEVRALDRRQARVEERLGRADDAYFSGEIDRASWRRQRDAVAAEVAAIGRERATLPAEPDAVAFRLAEGAATAAAAALGGASDGAVAEAMRLVGATLVLRDGTLRLEYDRPVG